MTDVSVVELRKDLADIISRVQFGGERICVTRNGKATVAIISAEDLELLEALEDHFDGLAAEEALEEALETGFIPLEDVLKEEAQ